MLLLRAIVLIGLALVTAEPGFAQTGPPDGPARLVARLEVLARAGTPEELASLLAPTVPGNALADFALDFFVPGMTRTVAKERDRIPLDGVPAEDGASLIVEFFAEVGARARIMSARIDVQRETDDTWKIVDLERLTVIEGLYQLRLDSRTAYSARGLTIDSEDFRITMLEGSAFLVESDGGVTGMVLVGRGEMRFTPPSETEQGQLRIFAGTPALTTVFDGAFVRFSPSEYLTRVSTTALEPEPVDRRIARRAEEIFARERTKSFNLDMSEVSPEAWFLLPPPGDFLAEINTRRYGTLTYTKSSSQSEDISLFSRERRRTMSIYQSVERLRERGLSYNEDDLAEFDVTSYDLEVEIDPDALTVSGVTRMVVVSKVPLLSSLTLRLAESLNVSSVISPELGRLLFFRVTNQNGIFVNLPRLLPTGTSLTVVVTYTGRIEPQRVTSESVALAQDQGIEVPVVPSEPSLLLSNRAYWYAQGATTDYATARMRITVPDGYSAVASGRLVTTDLGLRDLLALRKPGRTQVFAADDPTRYLAVVVSRFVRVADTTIGARDAVPRRPPAGTPARDTVALAVEANGRQSASGRGMALAAEDILRFYGTLMGDTPYRAVTLALVENDLPGGHSPAYSVVLNTPPPTAQVLYRNDPAAFLGFPEFFVAHELAHQWWGQAIGWNNYHEQWLSEGFAQYFSALYAQKLRGDNTFTAMLRQFRRWALSESDQGPVYLGYRLGHVKNNSRVFRALVYNKGAGVLHMLRRLVGDEVFFDGLRGFYQEFKFRKAGTDDFQRAMEKASGRELSRFFERWIYGADIPHVRFAYEVTPAEVVVRFEQDPDRVFDLPVTVSITAQNGRIREVVVPVTSSRVEEHIAVDGPVRQVQVNRDFAALAEFDGF